MNVEYISELMSKRVDKYEKAADVVLCVDGKTKDEVVEEIKQLF
jgi:shikimate kinase